MVKNTKIFCEDLTSTDFTPQTTKYECSINGLGTKGIFYIQASASLTTEGNDSATCTYEIKGQMINGEEALIYPINILTGERVAEDSTPVQSEIYAIDNLAAYDKIYVYPMTISANTKVTISGKIVD